MTQIIGAIGPDFLVQASDRLLSLLPSMRPHDFNANKSLILCAIDGIALIGYTGLAYIDDRPTDQWLAEKLTGMDLSHAGILGIGQHNIPEEPLHLKIERLTSALKVALSPQPGHSLSLLVTGWTFKSKRGRPAGYVRVITFSDGALSVGKPDVRAQRDDQVFHVHTLPRLSAASMAPVVAAVQGWTAGGPRARLEDALAATIREVRRPGVGPDCLTILMSLRDFPAHAWIRFMPEGPFTEAFTPWVLTPDGYAAPSAEVGGSSTASHGWLDVEVECAPPVPGSVLVASSSVMKREPPPR